MNIREKLVELLQNGKVKHVYYATIGNPVVTISNQMVADKVVEKFADYLIAHGVTVQEWIPVTERLPEKPWVSVLVHMPDEKPFPTVREGFISSDGIWHSALYNREPDEVTHWMPMPTPPKGE